MYNKSHYGIDLPTRKGTRVDAGRLEDVARHLGFEFVKTIHDATGREIRDWIVKRKYARKCSITSFDNKERY